MPDCQTLKPVSALLTAVAGLGLLAACASTQPTEPQTPVSTGRTSPTDIQERTVSGGFTIDHPKWKELGYGWDWTGFPGFRSGEQVLFTNVYDDIIVVQGSRASVAVIDASTGRTLWLDRLANPLTRFVGMAREGQTLYIVAESEVFIIDAKTGNWLDRQNLSEVVNTQPVLFEGNLLFGTAIGRVLSHRIDYGLTTWSYDVGSPIVADLVMLNGTIGAMSQSGKGLFVSATLATALGHPTTGPGFATDPVTDGQRMYVAGLDQSAYAFEVGADKHVWRFRTEDPITTQPTVHNGVFYLSTESRGLTAIDPERGTALWSGPESGGEVIATRNGSLVVYDGKQIKAVDPTNGDLISSFDAPGLNTLKAGEFDDGSLFGVTRSGAVIRFRPR